MVFGLPFMTGGVVLALIALGTVRPRTSGGPLPEWIAWCLALTFFVPGFFVFVTGIQRSRTSARLKRRREQHPAEPWLAEGDWDPEGSSDRPRTSLLAQILWMAFLSVFLAPFNYFVFQHPQKDIPFWVKGLVGFFDLVPVLMAAGIVSTLWHAAKYGGSHLRFSSFPFHLGGTLDVRLTTRRPIGSFERMTCTLRCVEERIELHRTSRGTSSRTVADQVWSEERVLSASFTEFEGGIPIAFRLPEGDYGTRLAEAPVRYWELEVTAVTPGLDFRAVFPVPVYAWP